jgi:hypothetical protein
MFYVDILTHNLTSERFEKQKTKFKFWVHAFPNTGGEAGLLAYWK